MPAYNKEMTDQLKSFWNWFCSAIDNSINPFEDSDFIQSLDKMISTFGSISWELGPGLIDSKNIVFVLSPDGDKRLLELTTKIINMAPDCKGYEPSRLGALRS